MAFVMNLCNYLYVLDFGVLIAQGAQTGSGQIPPTLGSLPRTDRLMLTVRNLQCSLRRHPGGARYRRHRRGRDRCADWRQWRWQDDGRARAIAELLPYRGGAFKNETLRPNNAERNLKRGIALVPEGRGILGSMSVEENLLMGLYTRSNKAQGMTDLAVMLTRFPILAERRHVARAY